MRVFWVLLSLVVVAGLVFVLAPAGGGSTPTAAPVAPVAKASATPTKPDITAEPAFKPLELTPPTAPAPQNKPSAAVSATATPEGSMPQPASKLASPADDASATTTTTAEAQQSSNPPTSLADTTDSAPAKISAAPQAIPGITDAGSNDGMFAKALEGSANGEPVTLPEHPVFKGEKSLPSRAVRKADGGLLVDDRFIVKGSGTAADPFVVPWDMIISAQETYKPRLGMTKIPQRVSMLDGKYIRIVGFIAFPITAASPKEALIMLNQWDGCCIGTPPSPYDAIEVKLAAPATGGQKTMASGTMTGIFKVDPYEDGGWLLGLFLMEDAMLTAGEPL